MFARYRMSLALVAGVAAGWSVSWLIMNAMTSYSGDVSPGTVMAPWIAMLYSTAFALSLMVPGFVAGLVAARRGILIGASAAAILAGLEVLSEALALAGRPGWSVGDVSRMLLSVLMRHPASIVASGVAGGCAELLRSNTSLERTRDR
jgi:hypothetical protein